MPNNSQDEPQEGLLDRIIFQGDNGFIIGSCLDKHNNKFTVLGSMVNPQIGMNYFFSGYWTENQKFGEQYSFSTYETIIPVDINGIFKYIVRTCKFVGSSVGNALVDKYGRKTLETMKTKPEQIAHEISGLSLDRAKEIQQTLKNQEIQEKVMVELEGLLDVPGMRKNLPAELIKEYEHEAAEIVKKNPYLLTDFNGVGFALADRVALNIGCPRDSLERKKAATLHCFEQNMQAGSTWIDKAMLKTNIQILIQVPDMMDGVSALVEQNTVTREGNFYALAVPAMQEQYIAKKLAAFIMGRV